VFAGRPSPPPPGRRGDAPTGNASAPAPATSPVSTVRRVSCRLEITRNGSASEPKILSLVTFARVPTPENGERTGMFRTQEPEG
jgi:hypothetical protein